MIQPTDPNSSPGPQINFDRESRMFLELREVGQDQVAIRVRPEYSEQLWELLKFCDPSIEPLDLTERKSIVYMEKQDGTPYLEGDMTYVEIYVKGELEKISVKVSPFFMAVAGGILNDKKQV